MATKLIDANSLRVGDTIKVWWHPGTDIIMSLAPYRGPLECLQGGRLATFAINKGGMTIEPGSEYELICPDKPEDPEGEPCGTCREPEVHHPDCPEY